MNVVVRLSHGPLAAVDAMVGKGPGLLQTRSEALRALAMRGFEDLVQHKRRILANLRERPYPLTVAVSFTEAEASALADLAKVLQGSNANRGLVVALNKVDRTLDFARQFYATNPTGRAIPFPDPHGGDETTPGQARAG